MQNSRRLFVNALGGGIALGWSSLALSDPWLADVHSHFALSMRTRHLSLREQLERNKVSLVSLAIVADGFLLQRNPQGAVIPTRNPKQGEFWEHFRRVTMQVKLRLRQENLPIVDSASSINSTLRGEPHIVLSTEGAYFLEQNLENLDKVYELGYRQIGLGHFVESDITDIRTELPKIGGLTSFGRSVITRCNELGILIDLAHSTDQAVEQAIDLSTAPLLWSHSSIIPRRSDFRSGKSEIMSISKATATKLAAKGGLIGVWPSMANFSNIPDYAEGVLRLIEWVGEDHIAFGTDMDGLGPFALFNDHYADLRKTVEYLKSKRISDATLKKLSIENYARVLQSALET